MIKNFKFIPYNKNLVLRARELRKSTTDAEKVFWHRVLKNKKFKNLKFTRQKPLGDFIADFYCAKLGIVIEIDGDIHKENKIRDKERDNIILRKFNIKVIRYNNNEILNNLERVTEDLIKKLS